MGKKAALSSEKRAQIVGLSTMKLSEREISRQMKVSKTAVHNAIKKFRKENTFKDSKRSGRPRISSSRDDRFIRKVVSQSPMNSAKKIQAGMAERGINMSEKTIRRRLSVDFGLKSYRPAQKPRLTEAMKKKRLEFAKRHLDWDTKMWKNVLFSNESSMKQFSVRKYRVWRPPRARYQEKFTIPTVTHPPSQMIWGAMSANGTAGLYFLPPKSTMNGSKYVELLKEKLVIHMQIHNCTIFMHDGAPCHKSKVVQQFLNSQHINVLDWPGNSPDLNPIENLWALLKTKVSQRQPSCLEEMRKVIKEVWVHELSPDYYLNLVNSMQRRLQEVIKNKGGHTKY